MTSTTQTRKAELEEKIATLEAQEREQADALLEQAQAVEAELRERNYLDEQLVTGFRLNATREAVKAKRHVHVERLRAEAELIALEIADLDEQLPERRAVVERLRDERQKLDAHIAEAQRPLHDLEGRRHRLEIEYWKLTHEADSFEQGTEAL